MGDHEQILATVKSLIKQFTGQAQTLTVPRTFVRLTGDHVVALVLNQILFWSDKTENEDGWFYKEHADWKEELEISPDQLRRAIDKLAIVGVHRKLRKVAGAPKLHFRIDLNVFTATLVEFLKSGASPLLKKRIIEKPDNQDSRLSDAPVSEVSDCEVSRLSESPIIESPDNGETSSSDNQETPLSDYRETPQSLSSQLNTTENTSVDTSDEVSAGAPAPAATGKSPPRRSRQPKPPKVELSHEEWIASLKADPTYAHVDIDRELGKMRQWCTTNRQTPSRKRFVNWINRIDPPLTNGAEGANGKHNEQPGGVGPRTSKVINRDYSVFARRGGSPGDR